MDWLTIALYITGGVITLCVMIAFVRSGKPIRSLLGSTLQGACSLAAVNVAGAFTGVSLGITTFTGGCCVVLGVPGVVAMLFLQLIFSV